MVRLPDSAQTTERTDEALGWAGDPRHRHLDCSAGYFGRLGNSFLGDLGGGPVFPDLWSSLRFVVGQPLARVRSWHRLQDTLDEQCRVSHRLFHDSARAYDLAMEPYAPPYRHDHRRSRSRDRRAA